jgi:DNA polymerase-3 subunit alpha
MSDKFLKEFGTIKIDNVNLVRLPSINLTDEEKTVIKKSVTNNDEFLQQLINKGWVSFRDKVDKTLWPTYIERLQEEFSIVQELGFVDYFLLVWRVINKARQMGAFIDWGRGSAAGSLIFFLIGVTGVDPIDKKLFFTRFISKVRAKKEIIV